MSEGRIALVTGVGPGTGSAIVRRFAGDYRVAMLARNAERLKELEQGVPNTHAYPCDVADADALAATVEHVHVELGLPDVVIHNAVGGAFGDFLSIEPDVLARNFAVNTMALLHLGRLVAPGMIERGSGAIVCTGNTAAYRGKDFFAGFAPTKAAQRILAGVHGTLARAEGHPRRLRGHRCGHRPRVGRAVATPTRRTTITASRTTSPPKSGTLRTNRRARGPST